MVITDIKQQLKATDRYSIFIDGRYSFSLGSQKFLELKLAKGQQKDQRRLSILKKEAINDKLYSQTLRYCSIRLHSQKEIEAYLQRKQTDPKIHREIIDRLNKIGLVNDLAFSKAWVNNRRRRFFSQRRIIQELRKKGVSNEIIASSISDDESDDSVTISELIRKKRQLAKYAYDDLKLMRYLSQQGYNYENIKKAVKNKNNDG